MKKLLILSILVTSFSFSQIITIIDKGVERKISVPDINVKARYISDTSDNRGIIVLFKSSSVDIKKFSNEYNLKLKKRLSIGYYIFKNESNLNDIELISKITKEEKNIIKTIRPNWALGMMPR